VAELQEMIAAATPDRSRRAPRTHRKLDARMIPGAPAGRLDDLERPLAQISPTATSSCIAHARTTPRRSRWRFLLKQRGIRHVRPLAEHRRLTAPDS